MSIKKSASWFVAGTDTGVGKTLVSCALLHAANTAGYSTLGLKPLAAGCEKSAAGLRNEDALALQALASHTLPYEQINPVALEAALAPHIAAAQEGKRLTVDRLLGYCRGALTNETQFRLVEGAGGWRVPLNQVERLSALPKALNIPVILVVGIRLGCLNHALLTAEAIARDGVKLSAWVACSVEEMPALEENINTLRALLPAPCLGHIPRLQQGSIKELAAEAASYLQIEPLIQAL